MSGSGRASPITREPLAHFASQAPNPPPARCAPRLGHTHGHEDFHDLVNWNGGECFRSLDAETGHGRDHDVRSTMKLGGNRAPDQAGRSGFSGQVAPDEGAEREASRW